MKAAILAHAPEHARAWVADLLAGADPRTLEVFLRWHGPASLRALLSWIPPWPAPSWSTFIHYGLADWVPVLPRICHYLSPKELLRLRQIALDIAPNGRLEERAYRLFRYVAETVQWAPEWGAAKPFEIIERGHGGSFHLAQTLVALLRLLWIPARVVSELALVPRSWADDAERRWAQVPQEVRRWSGQRVFFHPFCEVKLGRSWLPMDPQRAWYGWTELRQHLRVPKLLKLYVTSWQDYGRQQERTSRYLLSPLALAGSRAVLVADLQDVRRAAMTDREAAAQLLDQRGSLLSRIESAAARRWQALAHQPCTIEAPKAPSGGALLSLQAVVPVPFTLLLDEAAAPPGSMETRIVIGTRVSKLLTSAYRDAIHGGAHVVALIEGWGEGEVAARQLLDEMGCSMSPARHLPEGSLDTRVSGRGRLVPALPVPEVMDLRLAPELGIPAGVDTQLVDSETESRAYAWSLCQGSGRLTVAPLSLLAQAHPYATTYRAGVHRRVASALLELAP